MKIKKPIPSLIRVSNYTARVFYQDQTGTCFKCKEMGHVMQNCPEMQMCVLGAAPVSIRLRNGCSGAWKNPPIPSGETTNNNTINAHNSTESTLNHSQTIRQTTNNFRPKIKLNKNKIPKTRIIPLLKTTKPIHRVFWHPVMFNIRHRRHLPKGKKMVHRKNPLVYIWI